MKFHLLVAFQSLPTNPLEKCYLNKWHAPQEIHMFIILYNVTMQLRKSNKNIQIKYYLKIEQAMDLHTANKCTKFDKSQVNFLIFES